MAGRKKLTDKAKPITVYIKESRINELGGIEIVRENILQFISDKSTI